MEDVLNEEFTLKDCNLSQPECSLDSIVVLLKTIELQNKTLIKAQENNYQWNIQHHNNLKRLFEVLDGLQQAFAKRKERSTVPKMRETEVVEQPPFEVNPFTKVHSTPFHFLENPTTKTFHELVLEVWEKGDTTRLENLLRFIENRDFQQLKQQSVEVILPILANWLKAGTVDDVKLALVFLMMVVRKFPTVFSEPLNRAPVLVCYEEITKLREMGYISKLDLGNSSSETEIQDLRAFLKMSLGNCG